MIKAEDLRIGDLVKINENCFLTKKGTIGKVTDIYSLRQCGNKKGVVTLEFTEDYACSQNVWCCNIEGILLTPEILEKNGFEIREGTVAYAKNRLALKPLDEGKGYQVGLGSLRLFYIEVRIVKYVHELQHILWVLGESSDINI